jgi:tungstate transport system substrate-binding protein
MSSEHVSATRRRIIKLGTTALVSGPTLLHAGEQKPLTAEVKDASLVRIASVSTDVEGGLLPALLENFHTTSGLRTTLQFGNDPYTIARNGQADLVISHFGHRDTESFVSLGFGRWPRTIFANQLGLFGPPDDPANVRGLGSLVQAFRQIAQSGTDYVVNRSQGTRYLTDILWHAAGRPEKGDWYIDNGNSRRDAVAAASRQGAYVLWGLTPFQREQQTEPFSLTPLVTADPLLQRIMVSVTVNPERIDGVNAAGAARLEEYLLSPAVQARILTTPYPGMEQALWSPAGRHNAGEYLPLSI